MLFSKRTPEASSTVLASTAGYYSTQIGGLALVTMTVSQEGVRAFRAEKRSAQASAHLLSQAQGGLFCVLTACVDCVRLCVFVSGVLSEMHEVGTFAPCEAFLFDMFAFFFVA